MFLVDVLRQVCPIRSYEFTALTLVYFGEVAMFFSHVHIFCYAFRSVTLEITLLALPRKLKVFGFDMALNLYFCLGAVFTVATLKILIRGMTANIMSFHNPLLLGPVDTPLDLTRYGIYINVF